MKKISFIIISIVLLTACQNSEEWPKDLEGLKSLLTEKKKEVSALQKDIQSITEKITVMDPSLREKSKLVDTTKVQITDFERYITLQGVVEANKIVQVSSEVPGRIMRLKVREGDRVKRGQLLAVLDLELLNKQIAEIETRLSLARDIYNRQKRLWDQNIGSEVQYLQAKNNVDQLETNLETLRYQQTKANIYAPISGVIDMELIKQGEIVNTGMPIVQILNTSDLKVSTDLPERYLTIARKGAKVALDFPAIDLVMDGKITLLGRSINAANRTLKVEIKPLQKSRFLKPNLLTQIRIQELKKEGVIVIPLANVLQEIDGTEYVYLAVLQEDHSWRSQKRYITTGDADDDRIVVLSGLDTSDILITTGARTLSNQELIKINASIHAE